MLVGQSLGKGCLPAGMGLPQASFERILNDYFPERNPARPQRLPLPTPEHDDIRQLLLEHRAQQFESEIWIVDILAIACTGRDHLWQDLGLANRNELTTLMQTNFPALARANHADMKWKKFLYRELCQREGIYVCPAPSCGECKDYALCFGSEH